MSEIPDVGTWKTGALDTNPRCFDLLCTGKVQINSNDYKLKLDISAADRIPSFFTKNSAGEVVFAEPKPMCTIKMPRGHWGTVIVRLKNISTEQTDAENYVCLGVKEDGEITGVLYGDGAFKYIDMTDESNVELVPLISVTKLPEYTKAEIGTKVTFSNTNFDFGTVYRVTIDDEQKIEWERLQQTGTKLRDIANNGSWYIESSGVGVGPVKDKGVRMLAIDYSSGKLASSVDGTSWDDEGVISSGAVSNWVSGPVYGNGIWCAINAGGIVRYSTDNAETWLIGAKPPAVHNNCLAFGNGIFMTIGYDPNKIYASVDANTWELIGELVCSGSGNCRALYYDNNICAWFCIASTGEVYVSKDGRGTWKYIVSDDEGKNLHSIESRNWFTICYAHGYRYISTNEPGSVARSSNGKDWERVVNCTGGGYYNISFYNGRLYLFQQGGVNYYVGTFK